jgi:ABC-type transport system substrate-binding protein
MLRINMYRSPNSVKEFRHALSWAINRKEICEVVYHGYASPAPQVPFLPPALQDEEIIAWPGGGINPATEALYTDAERIAEANDILDDLGWVDGADGDDIREGPMGEVGAEVTANLEFDLFVGPNSSHLRAAEIVQENMEDIGIKVNIVTASYGTIFATLKNVAHNWDWYLGGHGAGFNYYVAFASYFDNPDDLSTAFAAGAVGFDDPTIQGKMVESLTATGAAFDTLVEEIQTLWADFLPYIPVHTTNAVSVYRTDNLTGWDLEEESGPPPTAIEGLFYRNLLKLEKAD